ncbi:MAG: protein kinase [Planctomycetaceae bacterium]|jgi:eukaryotic-like serine/threonine-protein kinase|nr:protein kinase [Planctomycetaceae bacterium]
MSDISPQKLVRRCTEAGVVEIPQLDSALNEAGGADTELINLTSVLLRKELITNWQLERLLTNKRDGYFYGKYKILYLVGAGTFARVYRAVNTENNRVCAVKVLRMRYSDDLGATEQFMREARMVIPLKHPNIVRVNDVDSWRGRYYMVMDFIEGQNLRDFLKLRKHMELNEAIRVTNDICQGLSYALQNGMTHRDMKLSNVLISSKGSAKLADFGLASMIDPKDDKEFVNAPNPRSIDYAGLERATNVPRNDVRSDIFFVGCMLYHMLSGRPPLAETRDRMQRLQIGRYRDIPPVGKFVKGLPLVMINIINKSIAFNPSMRYPNYDPFIADLATVQGADTVLLQRSGKTIEDNESPDKNVRGGVIQQEGENMTILVVDSRQTMQDLLRAQLSKRGYRVLFVSNAERAIQRLKDSPGEFDCAVFCTGELGESALNVFNQLADDHVTSELPALIIVEKNQASFASQARLSDLHSLLLQPVKVRELRAALVKVIGRRNQQ